jgi:DNA-binding transcriptional ArsR family regulator
MKSYNKYGANHKNVSNMFSKIGLPTPTPNFENIIRQRMLNMSDEDLKEQVFATLNNETMFEIVNTLRESIYSQAVGEGVGSEYHHLKTPFTKGEYTLITSVLAVDLMSKGKDGHLKTIWDKLRTDGGVLPNYIVYLIVSTIRKEGMDVSKLDKLMK